MCVCVCVNASQCSERDGQSDLLDVGLNLREEVDKLDVH